MTLDELLRKGLIQEYDEKPDFNHVAPGGVLLGPNSKIDYRIITPQGVVAVSITAGSPQLIEGIATYIVDNFVK